MQRHTFKNRDFGSYITVYKRKGENWKADLNFFDGDKELDALDNCKDLLRQAINYIERASDFR